MQRLGGNILGMLNWLDGYASDGIKKNDVMRQKNKNEMNDREVLKSLLDQMGYTNKFSYIFKNHVRLDGENIVRLKLKLDSFVHPQSNSDMHLN